jgi:HEAT repeat protein
LVQKTAAAALKNIGTPEALEALQSYREADV